MKLYLFFLRAVIYGWDVVFTFVDYTQLSIWYCIHRHYDNCMLKLNVQSYKTIEQYNEEALQSWEDE